MELLLPIWVTQVKNVLITILVLTTHLAQVTRVHHPQYPTKTITQISITQRSQKQNTIIKPFLQI